MNSVESTDRVYRYRCSRCPSFHCSSREELISHNSEHLRRNSLNRQDPPTSSIPLDEMSKGHSIESKGSNDIKGHDSVITPNQERKSNLEVPVVPLPGPSQRDPDLELDPGFKSCVSKAFPQNFDQNESYHLAKNDLRQRMKIIRKRGFTSRSALKNRTCSYCGKVLSQVRNRRDHERIHLSQKPFSCTMCRMKFRSDSSLRNHLRRICNKKKTNSNTKQVFKNKNVNLNQNSIPGKGVIGTSENFAATTQISHVKIQKTLELEPNTCPYCYRKLSDAIALGDHIRSQHTGEKPFHCHRCSEGFHSKKALRTHIRHQQLRCRRNKRIRDRQGQGKIQSHQPRKMDKIKLKDSEKVECPHCGRICARQQTLDDHIRSQHTGETPFKCDDCGYGFHSQGALHSHQMSFQGECEAKYKPPTRDYQRKGSLASGSHAGVNEPTIKIQNKVSNAANNSRHNETHTPRKITNQNARDIDSVENMPVLSRMGIQPVENFSCPYCKKLMTSRLNLIAHIRLHTGEKPFECSDCKARFFNLNTLIKHRENKQCLLSETEIKIEKPAMASNQASASKPMAVIGPNELQQQHLLVKANSIVASGSGSDIVNTRTRPLPLRRVPGPLSRTVGAKVIPPTSQGTETSRKIGTVSLGSRRSSRALTDAELEVAVNAESDEEHSERSENSRKMSLRARPAQKRSKYVDPESEDEDSYEDEPIVVNTNVKDKNYDINQTKNTTKFLSTSGLAVSNDRGHNKSANGKSCPFCQQTYSTDILLEHIRLQHLNDRPFQCILCDASFQLHAELLNHKVDFHRISRDKVD